MAILIDGHNLIPKIPGLSLGDFDDEMRLIVMLQEYARLKRKRIEVFFDKAPAGQPRQRTYGTIQVNFARPGFIADEEIRLRLEALGGKARHYVVVSSDHRVQTYARAAHAQIETAEAFSRQMQTAHASPTGKVDRAGEQALDEQEVAMWMEIFRSNPPSKKN